jgi:signal transduction histidine kinase
MFQGARLKLTAWYLFIIMLISVSFSLVIYKVLIQEVERFANIQKLRIERKFREGEFFPQEIRLRNNLPRIPIMDPELVEETKHRLILLLITVNGGILIISGGLGYFLAGRTLKPIKDMLDEQNRFITDSSHELRTPLTSLKSAMEVSLRDKNLSLRDAKTLISESIEEVDKLQSLSDELLQLAQYQKPQAQVKFENFSFSEAVKRALRKIESLAKQKEIKISDKTQDIKLEGNKHELSDLLVILLDNAIKYSPERKQIKISSRKTDGSFVFSVEDQGIGIDKKDIPHIFDRFYRTDTARAKKSAGGYGLGLSIAKKIVDIHHGSIKVESKPNYGSTFTVHLPVSQSFQIKKPSIFS